MQPRQHLGAIELDRGNRVLLGKMHERCCAGIENGLHRADVGAGISARRPSGDHLV